MTLGDYAIRSLHLDRQLRASSRITAYGIEVFRIAGIMALLVLMSDLTPWSVADGTPMERFRFVGIFSLAMAAVNLVRDPGVEATLDKLDRDTQP